VSSPIEVVELVGVLTVGVGGVNDGTEVASVATVSKDVVDVVFASTFEGDVEVGCWETLVPVGFDLTVSVIVAAADEWQTATTANYNQQD